MQTLRPLSRGVHQISRECSRRGFVSFPSLGPQTLSASRTIRAPPDLVYAVISDVSSYSAFLPYCQASIVTKTSRPTAIDHRRYPEEAKLLVGFNDVVSETFWSRVYCVPGKIVEAVSGATETTLSGDEIAHHSARLPRDQDPVRQGKILSHLLTRWSLRPSSSESSSTAESQTTKTRQTNAEKIGSLAAEDVTEVDLNIEYQFASPVYAALSQAAAPKVAEKMIEAFERRVKSVMQESRNTKR